MIAKKGPELEAPPRPWVALDPLRPGKDRARVMPHSIAVWALIGHLRGVNGDVAETAYDYDIPIEAVEAALAYYREPSNRAAIDALLEANRAAAMP
jgi:uncharacterized protein (DUF433 family)